MVRELAGRSPRIAPDAYVDRAAEIIGHVVIEAGASIWPFAVLRGDFDSHVQVGRNSNVQEGSVLHVAAGRPCIVGAGVTIGHRAVVHGCTIGDDARIGIGAIVLNGAVVEQGAQVGAGALVPPGKIVPAGWLVMGVPARQVRQMSPEELEEIRNNAATYVELWRRHYRR